MRYWLLLSILVLLGTCVRAQTPCTCPESFNWVKTTFEENDAGFSYALERKGREAYEAFTAEMKARTDTITDRGECFSALYDWLQFFRPGHIAIRSLIGTGQMEGEQLIDTAAIRERYADWERVDPDITAFQTYLDGSDDPYEDIWLSPPYRIGVRRMDEEYVGFVLEADSLYWMPGQVKLRFDPTDGSGTWYMQDHSPNTFGGTRMIGKNTILSDFIQLKRETPRPDDLDDPYAELYLRARSAGEPLLERLNDSVLYLRIPSFQFEHKAAIDSLIEVNFDKITGTENLILDIHSGTGGYDMAFAALEPILYTNRVRTMGVEFRSTPLNNQRMMDFATDTTYGFDDEFKAWARTSYDTLQDHLGEFVNLNEKRYTIETHDTIYTYPSRVAVIMDGGNGSTDEQFLLMAKQSRKVKLYGQSTFGVLDISNMYFVPSPCGDFELGYSLTRSFRIPGLAIDGVGLQPDFFIDDSVPREEWVRFVVESF